MSWASLAPSKSTKPSPFAILKPSKPNARQLSTSGPSIGRFPELVVLKIVSYLPIPDLPNVARGCRSLARLVRDERSWQGRCNALALEPISPLKSPVQKQKPFKPKLPDDDFGDFSTQAQDAFEDVDFGDFSSSSKPATSLMDFDDVPLPSRPSGNRSSGFFALTPGRSMGAALGAFTPGPLYTAYKDHHLRLLPLCKHLRASPSPSSTLSLLFPRSVSLAQQSDLLLSLLLFLSARVQPLRDWGFLRHALLAAADRFDSTCLVAFEMSDSRGDVEGMREAASASWKVYETGGGSRDQWECGRVWVEKREVFYETGKWDALENIVKMQTPQGVVRQLDFTPMDAFISHVLEAFRQDAGVAVQVFPPAARVIVTFADRLANDVIGEYIHPLLSQARIMSLEIFLQATAASFVQAWKLVDLVMAVIQDIPRTAIEDIIYRMFEVNMDEYLDDEVENVKNTLDGICKSWSVQDDSTPGHISGPTFLTASNPDQVKRNVLAGFKDVLLLPVTIVPRTVTFGVNALVSGSSSAVNGLSMLNPQKWVSSNTAVVVKKEVEDEKVLNEKHIEEDLPTPPPLPTPSTAATTKSFDGLQLLISLDIALELIHADRDALKRTETFAKYPGQCGHHVRETIEEIFILMLKAIADRHIAPGFKVATTQMSTYKPAEHEETTSVAPLLQFFELVHVGDTIQSMIQVYFDQELTSYVDKTDFLNAVMREKKRFEAVLDDAVAAGLNAGIEVLMNQVEHIIQVKTGPREYYPDESKPMELGPTEGCREAIACLEMHCNLLRGSTQKEVLEVFYQEVGIRLQAILQRHLKRQIISLQGGFQIIADLNAYHAFVASLKQQRITDDFSNLKLLGHVYIVSDAKDLAQIVRDVTRYGGTFGPEDLYEFIQRRSDWKRIEKTVDKAMYALSVKEDCVIM